MENEELFELLEKMYSEMQKGFKEIHEELRRNSEGIRKNTESIIALEGEFKEAKKNLYDVFKQNADMISEIKDILTKNTEDMLELSMTISGMKEDINLIASETIRNDSRIDKINEKLKAVK